MNEPVLRCDLHVHSIHSGRVNLPLLRHLGNDSYSDPLAVHETARRRGMTLVTLTDHDTIAGAQAIAHLPGTFVSEEVTCELPGGRQLHVNVFGIDEQAHERIARLRFDPEALFAFLRERRIAASVNHLFSAVTGARELADIRLALGAVRLIEAHNGMMPRPINAWAAEAGRVHGLFPVGGSDGHTLRSVARAWTEVPGARTVEEFLAGLGAGAGRPAGRHGNFPHTTADVARNVAFGYGELAPRALRSAGDLARFAGLVGVTAALPLLPLVTGALALRDHVFARRFGHAWRRGVRPAPAAVGVPAWDASSGA